MRCWPFDIETHGDESAVEFMPTPKAPSNYKDAEKIAAYIAEKQADERKSMSLDPTVGRIVALGYGCSVQVCPTIEDERIALTDFWHAWVDCPLPKVGYNVLAFDLPFLRMRSIILNVAYPNLILSKYKVLGVTDLMLDLHPVADRGDYKSMNFWIKRLGLDVPVDKTTGADVAAMFASSDFAGISTHCEIDLIKTAALYDRLYPAPDPDEVF